MTSGLRWELEGDSFFEIFILIPFFYPSRSVDIRCAPVQAEELTNLLSEQGIQFSVLVEDVQKLAEMVSMKKGSMSK